MDNSSSMAIRKPMAITIGSYKASVTSKDIF